MSSAGPIRRKTVRDLTAAKNATPLVCVTAYTAPIARLADPHADMILVGDSLGMVIYGFESTLPVTMDMMIAHGRAVVHATTRAFVAIDMPFGSYQESPAQAFHNAARLMAETGVQAVKLEGGQEMAETIQFLVQRGIPVIGHIGLQPQSVHGAGGYYVTGRANAEREKLSADAQKVAGAGAFAVVLECMQESVAAAITKEITIPTIGIGASVNCDGQILVCDDLLGLGGVVSPKFVKRYAALADPADKAFAAYSTDVRARNFPGKKHIYS